MNTDIISGKWTQLKGKAQAKWGDLTDDDFKIAEGNASICRASFRSATAGIAIAPRLKCAPSKSRCATTPEPSARALMR